MIKNGWKEILRQNSHLVKVSVSILTSEKRKLKGKKGQRSCYLMSLFIGYELAYY